MKIINAQTIVNTLAAAAAIAPEYRDELTARAMPEWMTINKAAPWGFDGANEFAECDDGQQYLHKAYAASNAAQEVGRDVVTRALCQVRDLLNVPARIKIQTSARGSMTIQNTRERLEKFAETVRKNAAAFGGGLIREVKAKPAVSWPANLISLFKQSIESRDYQAALDIGDKLGALFFVTNQGRALMQVAPVPCDFEPRLSSVCNEDGTYAVIFPQNMTSLSGASVRAKRSRAAQIENVQESLNARTNFNLSEALDKQSYSPVDQVATRAQWILEHGLSAESIETRIVAHESESIEQQAAQDVAQVVAQAVAAVAIGEAMQPSEAGELVTCEAGESEASAPTASQTSWAPTPQYVPPSLSQIKPGAPVPPAYRGGMDDTDPPSDGNAKPTTRPMESTEDAPELDLKGFTKTDAANGFYLKDGNLTVNVSITLTGLQAQFMSGKSTPRLTVQGAIDWADALRAESVRIAKLTPATPSVQKQADTPPAEFFGDATPPVAISSANFAGDIPLSLAVSAYNGVSMSPERRGASAKSEYAATMAADYEKLRAQAVKGGTLDLLPEVFARYRARQASAYRAYLSSSSRCVSSFIAGPANFPAARMNKRADIAHKRLNEYLDGGQMALQSAIRQLRPDLRAIMAGDADAIDRLTVKIEAAERAQASMKAANKAIRANAKQGEAHQVAALMELGFSERQASSVIKPDYAGRIGFASYELTNNNANIRRMRERLEQISKAQATEVQAVECANGVTLEDDAPANRVRLYFPGKPSEAIRTELKSSGFRWAPSTGAWQAYRNWRTLATARRMAGEPLPAAPEVAEVAEVAEVDPIEATPTVAVSTEEPTPGVAVTESTYTLPTNRVGKDWNGYEYAGFTPDARQQVVIDAVQVALNEKLFYTTEVLARCIELMNIDTHTASMNFEMRTEGGIVGMDCYYARHYIEAKEAREANARIHAEMDLRHGDDLGILVFTDYKRTTGVKITEANGLEFTFTGKRGAHTVQGKGTATQLKNAIDRAFTSGKRKTDYAAFLATQAKRTAPTPPAMESQPDTPVMGTEAPAYGEGLETWEMDALTFSKQSRDNPHWTQSYPSGEGDYLRDCFATHARIVAEHEAKQAQDVPTVNANEWGPAIGERYIGAVEYAVQEANKRGDGFEYRTGENALMERRKLSAVTHASECPPSQSVKSKSEKWAALLFMDAGLFVMVFNLPNKPGHTQRFNTASERMAALQAMARAADAPTDTPPGGGLPRPEPVAAPEPVASVAPTPAVAVSSASPTPRVAVRRNFIPDNGLHIVDDAFEAWTFPWKDRFSFVMYLGKSAKPWKMFSYSTEAKRDDGFNRHAQAAREIALSKANRKAQSKAQADKPHGLQVGDVVRSSWGYEQTNVNHYQIIKVIGKRTVEVRALAEHEEVTGAMTGRLAPVHGEFVGEVMRRQVDSLGQVNIRQAAYGRASKIEPLAIVHGVRCYAASGYSSHA